MPQHRTYVLAARSQATRAAATAAALLLAGCTMVGGAGDEFRGPDATPRLVTPEEVAERTITRRDVERHVDFLASDRLRGRGTPGPGLERAAAYISSRFQVLGLEPAGDGGGYLQYWPYERSALDTAGTVLAVRRGSGARLDTLGYGVDYAALPADGGGGEGGIAYLGRAEWAPDTMEVAAGRVAVVLLAGEDASEWRWPVTVRRSMITAARARARAVVFVLDEAFDADDVAALAAQFGMPAGETQQVPLLFARRDAAERILAAAGADLDALTSRTEAGDRRPVLLDGATLVAEAPAVRRQEEVPNVVARLPGSDLTRAEEYVILVAHYDHVGIGTPDAEGDSVYNGADDNASGVAALLEIAEAFTALPSRPARPVLFLATSGEEIGLLGATWFASNPSVLLSEAVAVLNMDMVGRNHPDTVQAVGYEYSSLGSLLDETARATARLGLTVVPDRNPRENFFQRSDHFPFARRGIPAILVFTGPHADYHMPSDEPALIDTGKLARVARLVFLTAHQLAAEEIRPEWTEEGRAAVRR